MKFTWTLDPSTFFILQMFSNELWNLPCISHPSFSAPRLHSPPNSNFGFSQSATHTHNFSQSSTPFLFLFVPISQSLFALGFSSLHSCMQLLGANLHKTSCSIISFSVAQRCSQTTIRVAPPTIRVGFLKGAFLGF